MKLTSQYLILVAFLVAGGIGVFFLYLKWENNASPTVSSDLLAKKEDKLLYTFSGAFTGNINVPGLTLSGGSLYGDPSKIKIDEKWVLTVILPDPSVPDSYTNFVIPSDWLSIIDPKFKHVAHALGTPSPEELAIFSLEERERYDFLKTLFSTEISTDPLAIATKKCFTDISERTEIPGGPEFLQKICQSTIPQDNIFLSILDPAYTRYSYHLFAQAFTTKDKSPCLKLLSTEATESEPLDRARDHLKSLMLCEAIAMRDPRAVIDRVYSVRFLLSKKRCDLYASFPEAQKLCEEILPLIAKR